ncbi:serum opacification factor [Streptococcus pyogenes]|uniref:serum opacification factor n=1 Tax=Streptococcus pyogenes TaxID=1314 RepID=UPI0010ECDB4A|nr:serum opacification factor [Streptococcus pyogenes]VHM01228.1 Serum opacity factor [Streptococcus pyogenes]
MTNCKYKLRKLSVGLVSVGTMLIAPTVLGQEVSTGATSTESSTTSTASASTDTATTSGAATTTTGTSGTAASGTASGTNGASSVTSSGGSQGSESAQASPQAQTAPVAAEATPKPQAQTGVASPSNLSNTNGSSSSETQTFKSAGTTTSSAPAAASNNSNKVTSTEAETPMMDVEQYTVDKKDSSVTQTDDKKLLKIRRDGDEKTRDLYDVKREVKDNGDGTLDVTLKVTPKQIDEGADVMALLDVSQKMTRENFDKAKEQIKKMVTTLTGEPTDGKENHNRRNSVRLMTFYREISDPIDISGKTDEELNSILDDVWKKAKKDWDWGVDLQGAIHKARDIFKNEKNSKKRQHIVLFSQGESTFSYDIKDKSKLSKSSLTEVTTSNPLLHWPPIFNYTNRKADMLDDITKVIKKVKDLGVKSVGTAESVLTALKAMNSLGSFFTGSLTEYITLKEYDSDKLLEEKYFDYTKRVGEGYYYHSFSNREYNAEMPFERELKLALETALSSVGEDWFTSILNRLGLKKETEKAKVDIIMKILNTLFYRRQYHYYNHNLSAIAEAKMAQEEGITFYSVDVTDLKPKRAKRQTAVPQKTTKKESEEDRNNKFDGYLKKMSEGGNAFFNDVDKADKFKDTLTELTIKDEFEDKVTVENNSWNTLSTAGLKNSVNHQASSSSSSWFSRSTKESLTWTISKDQLKKAFEDGKPLTLTYKLKVDNNKFKTALEDKKKRIKRSAPTENENSIKEKIISNTITYKINNQKGQTDKKLDDVNLTYSKLKVPVPQIDGHVIEPQAPTLPKLPPVIEHGPNFEYEEETGYQLPLEHGSNAPDIQVTIEEDTVPQRPDILVGGQSGPVDITEDTQPGMSGSNDATVIEEDTKPKRFFHFDNEPQAPEKPKEQPSLSLPQAPVYKAAHHLPASGDKREASFTIAALTIIGAAGLLRKKRRDTEEN